MSTHNELNELIHAEIDGTASPADRERLRLLLTASPEAREEHRKLTALKGILASVPPEAPPEPLRARIMRVVRAERARQGRGFFEKFFPSWAAGRIALPYAYAAAAGVIVGILGFHVVTGQGGLRIDAIERDAAATIGAPPLGTETGRVTLAGGHIRGSAAVRKVAGTLAIDIDFPAAENCGVRVAYDPAALKFVGVSNRTGGLDELQMGEGTIRWSSSRPQRVSVFLAARTEAPSRVSVSFMAGGSSGEGAVELPGLD